MELSLNYFVLGNRKPSNVKLSSTARIGELRTAIIDSNPDTIKVEDFEIVQVNCPFEQLELLSPQRYGRATLFGMTTMLATLLDTNALQDQSLVHLLVTPPRTLTLLCAVRSEEMTLLNTVTVIIDSRKTVEDLSEQIVQKLRLGNVFIHDDFELHKVSIPVDRTHPTQKLDVQLPDDYLPLSSSTLSRISWFDKPDVLSIILEFRDKLGPFPRKEDSGSYTDLVKRYEATVHRISKGVSACRRWRNPYDGRFADDDTEMQVTVPIKLFHPVFAQFLDDFNAENEAPVETIRKTAEYMEASSAMYKSEDRRRAKLTRILNEILSVDIQTPKYDDQTTTDEIVELSLEVGHALILVKEDQNEFGDGGPDPSTQGGLSFGRSWAQVKYKPLRDSTNCPTFIIATAGPWVAVLGAVFTDGLVVQRLTDYVWVGLDSSLNNAQIARVARLFHTLKTSLVSLKSFYMSLKITTDRPSCSRFFPSIDSYGGRPGHTQLVRFEYVRYLENLPDCAAFHARTLSTPSRDIVVKFADRYGLAAHELLANNGLAPKVLYCGSPWPNKKESKKSNALLMVVMELVDGQTLDKIEDLTTEEKERVRQQLQKAFELLHVNRYVYGDLRPPNVMITTATKDVKLIDFDWAGKEGQVAYPCRLSPAITWPKGAQPLAPITKAHDLEMLAMMF